MKFPGAVLIGSVMFALAALTVPASADAHHDGELGHSDGHIASLGNFKRVGSTTYRYLPALGEYEVRSPGRVRSFLHGDPVGEEDETDENTESFSPEELAPICRPLGSNRVVVVYTHRPNTTMSAKIVEEVEGTIRWMTADFADESKLSSKDKPGLRIATECNADN